MPARPGRPHLCTEAAKTAPKMLIGVEAAEWPPACTHASPQYVPTLGTVPATKRAVWLAGLPRVNLGVLHFADLLDSDRQK